MKKLQDSQGSQDIKPNVVSNNSKTDQQNTNPVPDTASVQNMIERCLQLYMNRDEVVRTLLNRARIDPGFTTLVWQKLEEENVEFFSGYYIRLKLKKQITLFNQLLEHQSQMMNYSMPLTNVPLAPIQNTIHHPGSANSLPMGYPIMHHSPVPVPGQPLIDPMAFSAGYHVVNAVPAPSNFQQVHMNLGNEVMMDCSVPVMPSNQAGSDMPVSPTSVASSAPFPFSTTDIRIGNSRESRRSLDQIPWNFSVSDLSPDMGDLGALGNYPGSPFLPPDSDIPLDSPEHMMSKSFLSIQILFLPNPRLPVKTKLEVELSSKKISTMASSMNNVVSVDVLVS